MTLGEIFKAAFAVVPSIAIGWVSQWADLFKGTLIMRPDASSRVSTTGVAVATLLAIVFTLLFWGRSAAFHKRVSLTLLVSSLLLVSLCYGIRFVLSGPNPRGAQESLIFAWDLATWIFIVAAVQTVLFSTLYAAARHGK